MRTSLCIAVLVSILLMHSQALAQKEIPRRPKVANYWTAGVVIGGTFANEGAVVAWEGAGGFISYRIYNVQDVPLTPATYLFTDIDGSPRRARGIHPDVAVCENRVAVITYVEEGDPNKIRVVTMTPSGNLSPSVVIAEIPDARAYPRVACYGSPQIDGHPDHPFVVWQDVDPTTVSVSPANSDLVYGEIKIARLEVDPSGSSPIVEWTDTLSEPTVDPDGSVWPHYARHPDIIAYDPAYDGVVVVYNRLATQPLGPTDPFTLYFSNERRLVRDEVIAVGIGYDLARKTELLGSRTFTVSTNIDPVTLRPFYTREFYSEFPSIDVERHGVAGMGTYTGRNGYPPTFAATWVTRVKLQEDDATMDITRGYQVRLGCGQVSTGAYMPVMLYAYPSSGQSINDVYVNGVIDYLAEEAVNTNAGPGTENPAFRSLASHYDSGASAAVGDVRFAVVWHRIFASGVVLNGRLAMFYPAGTPVPPSNEVYPSVTCGAEIAAPGAGFRTYFSDVTQIIREAEDYRQDLDATSVFWAGGSLPSWRAFFTVEDNLFLGEPQIKLDVNRWDFVIDQRIQLNNKDIVSR